MSYGKFSLHNIIGAVSWLGCLHCLDIIFISILLETVGSVKQKLKLRGGRA